MNGRRWMLAAAMAAAALSARAEQADRDKPTQVDANRMTSDEARRVSIFEGDVSLTKGTMQIQAERIVMRQDADGFQHATATGNPVHFREKSDPRPGQEAVWIQAEAKRIEIDEKSGRVELFDDARVLRDKDEVRGNYILYDQRSEFFSVSSGQDAAGARVRAVIQPKKPEPKPEPPAAGAPKKPEGRK